MYGKIFESLYEGSMVGAGPTVFAVWGYCIAKADREGVVNLNPIVLAPIIGTSRGDIERAIEYLESPDPNSKNPDHEGRRLLKMSGFAYFVVSHAVYRGMNNGEDRRKYMREYMRKRRSEETVNSLQSLQKLTKVNPVSVSVSASVSDGEGVQGKGKPPKQSTAIPECLATVEGFAEAFAAWVEFRAAKRAKATDRVKATILKRLTERPEQAVAALDTCMAAGWTDVRWDWIDNRNRAHTGDPRNAKPGGFYDSGSPEDAWPELTAAERRADELERRAKK
jgi:hypothetical protein